MRIRTPRTLRTLGGATALGLALALVSLAAPSPAEAAVPTIGLDRYVALGDSYSSGPFIPTMVNLDCTRSNNNYASTLAVKLGIYYTAKAFTDVTCGGADTTSMTSSQATPVFGTPYPPQFDALRPDTDLVTFTLGGNDGSLFGNLTSQCPAYRATDPTGSPCRDHYTVNGVDTMAAQIPVTKGNVAEVIRGVRERSPSARVLVVGYLRLIPTSGTCDEVPFATGDYAWGDSIERQLNSALAEAAAENGATFVDTYGPSLGHDACAGAQRWVQGRTNDIFAGLQYHPLRPGMDAVANLIYKAINGTDLARGADATASSTESSYAAVNAVDGNPYTRWASSWADGQWIMVDLGARKTIRRLELNWEYAYAKAYRVEVSNDGTSWQTVWSTINGDGGRDRVTFGATSARYVRVVGVTRATWYGISLYDLEVYSSAS